MPSTPTPTPDAIKTTGRGGSRPRAGRKPLPWRKGAPHVKRTWFQGLNCFHVTLSLLPGLPSLRSPRMVAALSDAFRAAIAAERLAPLVWSLQRTHCHMIFEAASPEELARGMPGLVIRMARRIKRVLERKGTGFAGRFYSTILSPTTNLSRMLRYVLLNHKKHERGVPGAPRIDFASSGFWFDGWLDPPPFQVPPGPPPVAAPRSSFLREHWRMHAPIGLHEYPGPGRFTNQAPLALS